MTTSSDQRTPSPVTSHGDHWLELTALLCRDATKELGDWISCDLAVLEKESSSYVTPRSLGKSLRTQSRTSA
jgi:hypothetical protein